jgi:hypothetical protein
MGTLRGRIERVERRRGPVATPPVIEIRNGRAADDL